MRRKLSTNGSGYGLSPGRCQAITLANAGVLLSGSLGTNFSVILIVLSRPQCVDCSVHHIHYHFAVSVYTIEGNIALLIYICCWQVSHAMNCMHDTAKFKLRVRWPICWLGKYPTAVFYPSALKGPRGLMLWPTSVRMSVHPPVWLYCPSICPSVRSNCSGFVGCIAIMTWACGFHRLDGHIFFLIPAVDTEVLLGGGEGLQHINNMKYFHCRFSSVTGWTTDSVNDATHK